MRTISLVGAALAALFCPILGSSPAHAHAPSEDMRQAAERFLAALTPEQRAQATFDLDNPERFNWHFIPRDRRGLSLGELTSDQHHLALGLLGSALSHRGWLKATTIMSLEAVLKELEQGRGPVRDPERYYLSIFGSPSAQQPWGWRFEGHHLSLNFTLVGEEPVVVTPSMFGSNPAEVRAGPRQGLRVLAEEEDLARNLVSSLNPALRQQAILSEEAPRDVLLVPGRDPEPLNPLGLAASKLDRPQRDTLQRLIEEYLLRYRPDLVERELHRLAAVDPAQIYFAWAGPIEPRQPHYYRVQTPHFVLEYDNTQNRANHIHTVWRDLTQEFGRDLLREHYEQSDHHQP